jgi:hypothetical protein
MLDQRHTGQQLPSANDVVAKTIGRNNQRQAALHGYTSARRYVLENSRHHKRPEMLVTVACSTTAQNSARRFRQPAGASRETLCSPGSLTVKAKHSCRRVHKGSRITPENYSFEMVGVTDIAGLSWPSYAILLAFDQSSPDPVWVPVRILAPTMVSAKT